ncbi:MAG: hypothetical protein ACLFPA_08005 [Dichotomicrobium sp.]
MTTRFASLAALAAAWIAPLSASAHESVVDHAHPHQSVFDTALLGVDALAFIGLGLAVAAAAGLVIFARRRK